MPKPPGSAVYGRARGAAPAPHSGNTFAKGVLRERDFASITETVTDVKGLSH